MSKYIIELDDRIKLVTSVGVTENGVVYTTSDYVHNLEELNSDYINEYFGELQDEAYKQGYAEAERIWRAPSSDNEFYQKGFEDGKNSIDMGCEGCRYSLRFAEDEPCKSCSNCYKSKYEPMSKEKDRIEVGDEVINNVYNSPAIVTNVSNAGIYVLWKDGSGSWKKAEQFRKTGKHYDIASILEAMRA